jgi:hypothetical protein
MGLEITGAMTTPTASGSGPIGMSAISPRTTPISPVFILMESSSLLPVSMFKESFPAPHPFKMHAHQFIQEMNSTLPRRELSLPTTMIIKATQSSPTGASTA